MPEYRIRVSTGLQPGDDAADLGSGTATNNYVLTADGSGGAAWEAPPEGGEGGTSLTRQHAFAAPYSYCGTAPVDSLEARRGQRGRRVSFTGVDADTLSLPALLGAP
jgi:hypothetical protein